MFRANGLQPPHPAAELDVRRAVAHRARVAARRRTVYWLTARIHGGRTSSAGSTGRYSRGVSKFVIRRRRVSTERSRRYLVGTSSERSRRRTDRTATKPARYRISFGERTVSDMIQAVSLSGSPRQIAKNESRPSSTVIRYPRAVNSWLVSGVGNAFSVSGGESEDVTGSFSTSDG